jgi:hypothetical protein
MAAPRSLPTKVFSALASLRLAVVTMLTLAVTCATATFYESKHGTAAAQREFYKTPFFALILITLGANIFCVMMSRYPWKKHHVGFVLAHIGILALLTGSLISLHYGLDSNMALYEGETSNRLSLIDKALVVSLPGESAHGSFPVDFERDPPRPGHERRFAIPGSEMSLVAEQYLPHVTYEEVYKEATEGDPVLHFLLVNPFAKEDGWLDPRDPQKKEMNFGPATLSFREATSAEAEKAAFSPSSPRNEIRFVLFRDGALRYGFLKADGTASTGRLTLGKAETTPWMGMTVNVDHFLPRARPERKVSPAPLPDRDELMMPAVLVHLEGPKGIKEPPEWLLWTETKAVPFEGSAATLAYRAPEVAVPFKVTLLKFRSDKYPGSNMPATYESFVKVDDPEQGSSEHHISMNHPLHYRGYIFFQASYVEGQPMMSIFSVARAPGLPLVYLGVALIASGVAWMFYLKPFLAKRQGQKALEARRKRETEDAAKPAAAARRPQPARPASSGA